MRSGSSPALRIAVSGNSASSCAAARGDAPPLPIASVTGARAPYGDSSASRGGFPAPGGRWLGCPAWGRPPAAAKWRRRHSGGRLADAGTREGGFESEAGLRGLEITPSEYPLSTRNEQRWQKFGKSPAFAGA
jgi:hypothetical protein